MEPQNYQDAINDPIYGKEWELAIKEEYDSLMKNSVCEPVELPPGKNLITGFSHTYGLNYFETYVPVAKLTTHRVIFALAARAAEDLWDGWTSSWHICLEYWMRRSI